MQSTTSTPSSALYNFKLLEALRSDDPKQVHPFVDELKPSPTSAAGQADVLKAGNLLGMAVRVASGENHTVARACKDELTQC